MQVQRINVIVGGDPCDVHARIRPEYLLTYAKAIDVPAERVAWCAVYVRPVGPVAGYWYEPPPIDAEALLTSLDVLP